MDPRGKKERDGEGRHRDATEAKTQGEEGQHKSSGKAETIHTTGTVPANSVRRVGATTWSSTTAPPSIRCAGSPAVATPEPPTEAHGRGAGVRAVRSPRTYSLPSSPTSSPGQKKTANAGGVEKSKSGKGRGAKAAQN